MLIGYMRVSTGEQSLDLQRDVLGRCAFALPDTVAMTRREQACVGFLFRCYSDPVFNRPCWRNVRLIAKVP